MIWTIISAVAQNCWQIFYGCMACLALEILWPRGSCSMAGRFQAALFWTVNSVAVIGFTVVFSTALSRLNVTPLLTLDLAGYGEAHSDVLRVATWILAPILAIMLGDFFAYWLHRALHAVPVLWSVHRLHHAVRDLSGWTSYSHFVEGMLHAPFVALPLALLVHPATGYAPAVLTVTLGMLGYFQHACTRLHFGPLRYVFVDNRYHRIHHARDAKHHNLNYGNFTTIWDQLFGTAYFPKADEWPDTGLAGLDEPRSIAAYVLYPLQPVAAEPAGLGVPESAGT